MMPKTFNLGIFQAKSFFAHHCAFIGDVTQQKIRNVVDPDLF